MKFYSSIVLFFSLSIFSTYTFAANKAFLQANQNVSYFDQLQTYFSHGTKPSMQELVGWWTGRCYKNFAPNIPVASLLTAEKLMTNPSQDNGPLFSKKASQIGYHLFYIFGEYLPQGYDERPDYFDYVRSDQIADIINLSREDSSKAQFSKSTVTSYQGNNLEYSLRKYDNYLISQAAYINDQSADGNVINNAGTVILSCYYFKKIHN